MITIFIIGIILTILIFLITSTNKINYTAIGDSISINHKEQKGFPIELKRMYINKINDFNNDYCLDSFTSRELYDILIMNSITNNKKIQQIINESDILTLSIGHDELNNGGNVKLYLYYMDLIMQNISAINNGKKILISVPLMSTTSDYVNNELLNLSKKHNFKYIDLTKINKHSADNVDNDFTNLDQKNLAKYIYKTYTIN